MLQTTSYKQSSTLESAIQTALYPSCSLVNLLKRTETLSLKPEYQASSWVKLLALKNEFSFDEALLLCQQSEDEWVAWIPDCGETVLHTSQFCPLE